MLSPNLAHALFYDEAERSTPFMQNEAPLTPENACSRAQEFIETIPPYPGVFSGQGIVICGGGLLYFTNAWVCINMLRRLGCTLPIQLWHLGEQELDEKMRALVRPLGVECVDALQLSRLHPVRILNGWELKAFALLHCSFREVLLLDADNVPVLDPTFLFSTPQYQSGGALFWPDYERLAPTRPIWRLCGVRYRDEPEFESGQIVLNKETCWQPLCLAHWYNQHSDFFYEYIWGDKETFHMAFRKLNFSYAMPERGIHTLPGTHIPPSPMIVSGTQVYPMVHVLPSTMCQHDFEGRRLFQHRNSTKWRLLEPNKSISDFMFEAECWEYVNKLAARWDGNVGPSDRTSEIVS